MRTASRIESTVAPGSSPEGARTDSENTAPCLPPVERWPRRPRLVSVVCPVFKEAAGIAFFLEALFGVLDGLGLPFEVLGELAGGVRVVDAGPGADRSGVYEVPATRASSPALPAGAPRSPSPAAWLISGIRHSEHRGAEN